MSSNPATAPALAAPTGTGSGPPAAAPANLWLGFKGSLRAVDALGVFRKTPEHRVQMVTVNRLYLFRSLTELYKRILTPRLRRVALVPANELSTMAVDCSRYLARQTMVQMAQTLRCKLESYGYGDMAYDMHQGRTFDLGISLPDPIVSLIETFGTFLVRESYHDRVLYVANLRCATDGRFNIPAEQVRNVIEPFLSLYNF